jgi:programmed cell death 6-interacting protein
LQRLENAYFKYKEIVSNLEVGRKFYNDLSKILDRFRDEVRNYSYGRRAEAAQLETDLCILSMAPLSISARAPTPPSKPDAQPVPARAPVPDDVPDEEEHLDGDADVPLVAPLPTRVPGMAPYRFLQLPPSGGIWQPEMGIKFGPAPAPDAAAQRTRPDQPRQETWNPAAGIRFG